MVFSSPGLVPSQTAVQLRNFQRGIQLPNNHRSSGPKNTFRGSQSGFSFSRRQPIEYIREMHMSAGFLRNLSQSKVHERGHEDRLKFGRHSSQRQGIINSGFREYTEEYLP